MSKFSVILIYIVWILESSYLISKDFKECLMVTAVSLDPETQVVTKPSHYKIKMLKKVWDNILLFKTKTEREEKNQVFE